MADKRPANWSDLAVRIVSGALMAFAALASAWVGGWVFFAFWLCAALAVLAEWLAMVTGAWRLTPVALAGALAVVLSGTLAFTGHAVWSLIAALAGSALIRILARTRPDALLTAASAAYASAAVVPVILLRADPLEGVTAIFFLFAVVWGSDIMAYFTGRTVGGPKLWPTVSPKKTWSGFVGGTVFGALAGTGVAFVVGLSALPFHFMIGVALAVVSQGGDLLESALKRHFGVKDASHLIPGHGGVMDRLDGFIAASLLAVLIGLCRDFALPAVGLLQW
jgi:phosphatidate cytidylyltransferase